MGIKSRKFATGLVKGQWRSSQFEPLGPYTVAGITNTETILSNSHFQLDGGRWSGGGPMLLQRGITSWNRDLHVVTKDGVGNVLTDGTVRLESPAQAVDELTPWPPLTDLEMDALGTTAIARTEPLNPAFDLATAIGELRSDGLPNIPNPLMREQVRALRSAGDNYLNVEFGWLPLVRDVRGFASTVQNSDAILRQFRKDANHVIKRRYEWPEETDSNAAAIRFSSQPPIGFFEGGGFSQHRFRKKWFEAEYEFYLPTGGSIAERSSRYASYARKLLGVDLNPEVLWNLSPWSWAADWFSNTGDVMHNLSALGRDGLVMRNGYMMCHSGVSTVSSGSLAGNPAWYQVKTSISEVKQRRPATPYGFGVSFGSLSAKQIAILSALGLSQWA